MTIKKTNWRKYQSKISLSPSVLLGVKSPLPRGDASDLIRGFGGVTAAAERHAQPRRHRVYVQVSCWRLAKCTIVKLVISEHRVWKSWKLINYVTVADPGFPRGGCSNPRREGGTNMLFDQFFLKTAWKWNNFSPEWGGHASFAPLRSATEVSSTGKVIFSLVFAILFTEGPCPIMHWERREGCPLLPAERIRWEL